MNVKREGCLLANTDSYRGIGCGTFPTVTSLERGACVNRGPWCRFCKMVSPGNNWRAGSAFLAVLQYVGEKRYSTTNSASAYLFGRRHGVPEIPPASSPGPVLNKDLGHHMNRDACGSGQRFAGECRACLPQTPKDTVVPKLAVVPPSGRCRKRNVSLIFRRGRVASAAVGHGEGLSGKRCTRC